MADIKRKTDVYVHLVDLTEREFKLVQRGLVLLEKEMDSSSPSSVEDIEFISKVMNYSPKLGF